jgi:hypothetical protein
VYRYAYSHVGNNLKMRSIFIILVLLFSITVKGQYYDDHEIDSSLLTTWEVDSIKEYSGTYFFGFAEGDDELRIFINKPIVVAQRIISRFNQNGDYESTYFNFTNVRVDGSKFSSDQTNGEFMTLNENNNTQRGLFLNSPWTEKFNNGGEFGSRLPEEQVYLQGSYPQGSTRLIRKSELDSLNLDQLQVFRNEIFARYGHSFRNGGKMDKYFSKTNWYKKSEIKGPDFLTEMEKINIALIKQVEKEKKSCQSSKQGGFHP